jgi:glucose/arabinose dehydrogenase
VGRHLLVVGVVALPAVAAALALACSGSSDGGANGGGAGADASDGLAAPCTPIDVKPGAGTKFCDLPGADATGVTVPPEFCVREYTTTPVGEARVLRFAPNGDLFVTAPSMTTVGAARGGPGAIVVLPDDDGDGRADAVLGYAGAAPDAGADPDAGSACAPLEADPNGLACVHGLAFAGNYVYFTRSDEVRRFPYAPGDRAAPAGPSELVATLGGAAIADARWTHTLELVKDGSLYVSRGRMDTDECSPEQMSRGAVFALHVERNAPLPLVPELVADGFRNPMYLRCSPSSCGDCYASELSGDNWDGVGGREKLALLEPGGHWGFPCCVGRDQPVSDAGTVDCSGVSRELVGIRLHDTNFGLDFERGVFPAPYAHGIFVALHGATSSFGGTAVVWLPADPTTLRPSGAAQPFATGFAPSGRATDVAFAPDGRLFVADDTTGKIYWIAPRTLASSK